MKRISIWICLLLVLLFCVSSQGADRYIFVVSDAELNQYYLDTQTVRYVNDYVLVFWDKMLLSVSGRNQIKAKAYGRDFKKKLDRTNQIHHCVEINFLQNTYRMIEIICYGSKGNVIYDTSEELGGWQNIPPGSVVEFERDMVYQLLGRSSRSPAYTPTPAPTQPPIRTPNDQKEYQQLQEYFQWLSHQPDYPEFDRWISQKFVTIGITAQDLNSYLIGYINGGGRYVDIQGMIAGWYREFYQERYGSR